MEVIKCVIVGAVQGLTEFLPVSSSGHILIAQRLLGLECDAVTLSLALHLGTLAAVAAVYFKEFLRLFRPPFGRLGLLALASLPAAAVGLALGSSADALFGGGFLWAGFLLTAVLLFFAEKAMKKNYNGGITAGRAAIMGLAQAAALVPGLSRSGATVSAGLLAKGDKAEVTTFSFLMSAPIIVGACAARFSGGAAVSPLPLLAGFLSAALFGFLAIRLFARFVRANNFLPFRIYLIVAAVASIAL